MDRRILIAAVFVCFASLSSRLPAGPAVVAEPLTRFEHDAIQDIAYSPDGQLIATAGLYGTTIWNANTGAPAQMLNSTRTSSAVAFSPDSQSLLTGDKDNTARLWDVADGSGPVREFVGHIRGVTAVAFSPDGTRIATGNWDGRMRLWDINDGSAPIRTFNHTTSVMSVAFTPDGTHLMAAIRPKASDPGSPSAALWDAGDDTAPLQMYPFAGGGTSVEFSRDGSSFVLATEAKQVAVLPTLAGIPENFVIAGTDGAFAPDGGRVLAANGGAAELWNQVSGFADPGNLAWLFEANAPVTRVAFSPDSSKILAGTPDAALLFALHPAVSVDRPGYEIDTLATEKLVYGDRDYKFAAPVPGDLAGWPYIRTLNDDKDETGFGFLHIQVDRPVTVVVAHDARFPNPPAWLQFWRKRSDVLTTTDYGPERVLYERDFSAGEITLGANRDPGMPEDLSMYSVVIISRGPVPARAEDWIRYE